MTQMAKTRGKPPDTRKTFATGLVGRNNAFGLMRLIFAILVIVGHAFPIGGWGEDPTIAWTRGQAGAGALGLIGFFALSGYLMTKTAQRTAPLDYMWRRFIRIMPGFWFVLVFMAFLIGPTYYHRVNGTLDGYLAEPEGPFSFVGSNFFLIMQRFTIHNVFEDSPFAADGSPAVLNGSLWTLFYQVMCYILICGVAAIGLTTRRRRWAIPALAVVFYLVNALAPTLGITSFTTIELTRLGSVFLTGATIAVWEDVIPFNGRLAILCIALIGLSAVLGGMQIVGYAAYAYLVLWAAGRAPRRFHRFASSNDLSFGVYIFGWPVQMILAIHGVPEWGLGWYILASVLCSLALAAFSWWIIEKPVLKLKNKPPWRWIRIGSS